MNHSIDYLEDKDPDNLLPRVKSVREITNDIVELIAVITKQSLIYHSQRFYIRNLMALPLIFEILKNMIPKLLKT